MKSLLYQGVAPFENPPACAAIPCRTEVVINIRKYGRIYSYVLRDKIVPEDPYLVMVKAAAFAVRTGEPYNGSSPGRAIKDFLIKQNLTI